MKSTKKRLVDKCRTLSFCWRVLNHYGHQATAADAVLKSGLDGASWSRAIAPFFDREGQFAPLPTGPRGSKRNGLDGEYLRLMEVQFLRDGFSAITWYTHGPDGLCLWEILLATQPTRIYDLAGSELRETGKKFACRLESEEPVVESFSDLCCYLAGARAAWLTVQPHLDLPRWAQPDVVPRVVRDALEFNLPLANAILRLIEDHDRQTIHAVYQRRSPREYIDFSFFDGYVSEHMLGENTLTIGVESGHETQYKKALAEVDLLASPTRVRQA